MTVASGYCVLVLDGQAHLTCSYALELSDGLTFGFLSGPSNFLKAAHGGGQAEIQLDSGENLKIEVLQVNSIGLALISIRNIDSDRETSTSICEKVAVRESSAPTELATIGRVEVVIEQLLQAEGFKDTTVCLCAYRDAPLKWHAKVIGGSDDREGVEKALHRLLPELQKRFRLIALRRRESISPS